MTSAHRLPPALADDLDLIAEMTADFARSRDIEETLKLGLARIAGRLGAEAASLFLIEPESGTLVCRACYGPADVTGLRLPEGKGIVWRTVTENRPQLVADTRSDADFAATVDRKTGFVTRSILCAPLSVREDRLGAIELFNKDGHDSFSDADARLVLALSASAALALVNARMASRMAEQEAMAREMALAADIQRAMLPGPQPACSPVHGINLAARGVSGDFFEIVPLPDGRIAFAIGDVSGKGVNASLLMAKTASLFRCLAKRILEPGDVLAAIDAELAETGAGGLFVTMIAGVLDPMAGTALLANAGHEPPLLIKNGQARIAMEDGLPPVGILPELFAHGCPQALVDLEGGMLALFTDGMTEARIPGDGMVGAEGVCRILDENAALPAPDRLTRLVDEVVRLGGPPRDDLTMLLIEDVRSRGIAVERRFPARPDSLTAIRAAVGAAAKAYRLDAARIGDLVLATDEACQNIIRHAYAGKTGDIVVRVELDENRLTVQLTDFAPPVDPATIRPRELDHLRPGGLGTHFIAAVMDEVAYAPLPDGGGNVARLSMMMAPT